MDWPIALSALALVVALVALARSGRREPSGPRPNVLSAPTPYPAPGAGGAPGAGMRPGFGPSAQVLALIQAGRKIEAIKQYRIETGAGLKDAKDAVEAFEQGMR